MMESKRRKLLGQPVVEKEMSSEIMGLDQFDRIPDCLVLTILNMLKDVRSLSCICAVSKRFSALVPLVHDVYVKIDRVVVVNGDKYETVLPKKSNLLLGLLKPIATFLLKPFNLLRRNTDGGGKPLLSLISDRTPAQVLRKFTHIRNLVVEFPVDDVSTEKGVVVKWRAEFGSSLRNFVILVGRLADGAHTSANQEPSSEDGVAILHALLTSGELKRQVIWTASSLVVAYGRHILLYPTIIDHPTLNSLMLTDTDRQGTVTMGMEELKEFREMPITTYVDRMRLREPTLKLKYAANVELPRGMAMQGATLTAIKPTSEGSSGSSSAGLKEAETFVSETLNEHFEAAVMAWEEPGQPCNFSLFIDLI